MGYWTNTVAEMTGIPKNTLIAWERRYGLVTPERTGSGYRIYSDEDVAVLTRVKELIDSGYRISEVIRILERGPSDTPTLLDEAGKEGDTGLDLARRSLLERLLAFDLAGAEALSKLLVTTPFETLLDEVYLPLLHDVGARWEQGTATVAQEHLVSGWCRERILAMARSVEPSSERAPEAICATAAGEHHEFGALGVAFHLANRGYRILYLGTDVPSEELLDLIHTRRPAIVALSAVLARPDLDLVAFGQRVLQALGPVGRVLIGGRAADGLERHSSGRLLLGARAAEIVKSSAPPLG